MTEPAKRESRAALKRRAIMDAAWRIFAEQGYERASVEAILTLCGGSKATIYSYFKSKADLFQQVSLAKAGELSAIAFRNFPEHPEPVQALYLFGVRYLSFYLNSDLIEVFRLAAAEGKSLRFGALLYEKNFKPSWGVIAAYLEEKLEPAGLLPGGGWTAAMHLRGLLDGDTLLQRSWGLMPDMPQEEYERMSHTAIEAFLRIYPLRS